VQRSHSFYVWLMVLCCVLWSVAGVVTRLLERAQGVEITFWRSLFAGLSVAVILSVQERGHPFARLRASGWAGVLSGAMWAVMFTCFMLALARTSVANTLIVNALYPVFAALLGWAVLRERPAQSTLWAIAIAIAGLAYMVWGGLGDGVVGMLIALGVPVAAAINVVLLRKVGRSVDLIPAVLIGGLLSAAVLWPFVGAVQATPKDIALLAGLGLFQLAIPCAMVVVISRHLKAAEVALLTLLEAVLGPIWAWMGVGETPATATLIGGGIALAAIALNELFALRDR
jgi:drug/metabolite transporter (DMT)-like permease